MKRLGGGILPWRLSCGWAPSYALALPHRLFGLHRRATHSYSKVMRDLQAFLISAGLPEGQLKKKPREPMPLVGPSSNNKYIFSIH
jgi:hypothetical protein